MRPDIRKAAPHAGRWWWPEVSPLRLQKGGAAVFYLLCWGMR